MKLGCSEPYGRHCILRFLSEYFVPNISKLARTHLLAHSEMFFLYTKVSFIT